MSKASKPLFFIHIPKTAGTSFRKAAESYFGAENTYYDYGGESNQTHPKILQYDYKKNDLFASATHIIKHGQFLSGHVPYAKYAPFFHPKNIITFIRSPEQKMRSQFEHHIRHLGYQDSFKKFITEKRFANTQSRILSGLGIEGLGFVGLTEEYETSLTLMNALFKTDFKPLRLNTNQQKDKSSYILSAEEIDLIQEHNQEDIALYKQGYSRFQRQKKSIEKSTPFVRFGLLPLPPQQAQHRINGWLTCYESSKAQELAVFINGTKVETIIANEYRSIASERNMNRAGFIGFTYSFPKSLNYNDTIMLYSTTTNELVYSTRYTQKTT